jgi:hypothetical protein
MLGRHKLLFIIPAIILIPILLGMTPLNMAHRLAGGGPFTHGKQGCINNYCPYHSLTSHDDPIVINLASLPLDQGTVPDSGIRALDTAFIPSTLSFNSAPLRC